VLGRHVAEEAYDRLLQRGGKVHRAPVAGNHRIAGGKRADQLGQRPGAVGDEGLYFREQI